MSYKNLLAPNFLCMFFLACWMSQTPAGFGEEVENRVIIRLHFQVHIVNGFADNAKPLVIHCRSKDDDLGEHTLWKGQEFRFEFGISWVKSTHFSCNFKWGLKKLDNISVFKHGIETWSCKATGLCFWKAAADGIYFSNNNQNWEKRFDW
ncbi:Plant self-incompatibility S1 [Corchorus olitorius]|uniref:S-protein homolog n=1 Tax=Corchorus olitorius TaxID=93759 RepID=A0A1R3KQ08_9ROSI|nr:Plant self-incompatibility S1 [Corchorus olitorius]